MKKLLSITLFLALLQVSVMAQVKQSVTKSAITFQIKNLGFNVPGSIGGLQADIDFDPANPDSGKIEASVEVATLNTDNDARDKHVKSEDYFAAAKFPKITLKSVSIKHKGGENYVGEFNVTIKDKTKLVEVPFTYTDNGKAARFSGKFKINREDFGIGGKSMVLSDEANISIEIETSK